MVRPANRRLRIVDKPDGHGQFRKCFEGLRLAGEKLIDDFKNLLVIIMSALEIKKLLRKCHLIFAEKVVLEGGIQHVCFPRKSRRPL
ncbi:MAG: hypothetical protein ACJAVK_002282 [Akkermansiaceae bacterium]|jgi:hypothetical protein